MANTGHKADICLACEGNLPWLDHACRYCALPINPQRSLCQSCSAAPPPYSAALCGFEYRFPVDHLVRSFKDNHNLAAGYLLSSLTSRQIMDQLPPLGGDALILPVPLHWRTYRRRGFNQSWFIAQVLGKKLGLRAINPITKKRYSKPQKSLSLKERHSNLQDAFYVRQRFDGRRVLLVDDVITTGATVTSLSQQILDAGAADVIVLALARTPSAPNPAV